MWHSIGFVFVVCDLFSNTINSFVVCGFCMRLSYLCVHIIGNTTAYLKMYSKRIMHLRCFSLFFKLNFCRIFNLVKECKMFLTTTLKILSILGTNDDAPEIVKRDIFSSTVFILKKHRLHRIWLVSLILL